MKRFRSGRRAPRRNQPLISHAVDAALYLLGYAALPFVFLFLGIARGVRSPFPFAVVAVIGAFAILTVKYLPRAEWREGTKKERDVFRHALTTAGISPRWTFLLYVSMGGVSAGLALSLIRFALAAANT